MTNVVTHQLDARRLLCPLPVSRLQQLIDKLGRDAQGDRVEAVCTDPGVMYDIPSWAKIHGHKLIEKKGNFLKRSNKNLKIKDHNYKVLNDSNFTELIYKEKDYIVRIIKQNDSKDSFYKIS